MSSGKLVTGDGRTHIDSPLMRESLVDKRVIKKTHSEREFGTSKRIRTPSQVTWPPGIVKRIMRRSSLAASGEGCSTSSGRNSAAARIVSLLEAISSEVGMTFLPSKASSISSTSSCCDA